MASRPAVNSPSPSPRRGSTARAADRAQLTRALTAARDLPDGPGKVAELERIAAHADATVDLRLGVDARLELLDAYQYGGEPWRLREPLHRCLAAVDRAPGLFDRHDAERLRWHQRAAVAALLGTPRVGLEQARATLADLARRDHSAGRSPQSVAQLRCRIADHLGDEPTARSLLARWRSAEPDPCGDCPGCAPVRQAELLAGWGDWAEALARLTAPGRPGCTDQPERGLAAAILPRLHLGDVTEAGRAHLRAWRRHRREWAAFPQFATHLRFCALAGYPERGLDLLAGSLARLDRPTDEFSAMEFAAAGALVCVLAVEAGLGGRRIHRPAYGARRAVDLDVGALGAELSAVATDLAGRFDARNGTGHQSGRMAAWLAARPLVTRTTPTSTTPASATPTTGPVRAATTVRSWVPLPTEPGDEGEEPEWAEHDPAQSVEGQPSGETGETIGVPTLAAITDVLRGRSDRYTITADGTVAGRWGDAVIRFALLGEGEAILHAQVTAGRRLPAARLAEAYEFCNAWNRDRLLPTAYVRDTDGGELVLVGTISTDLAYGVAPVQLRVLVEATVATGAAFATAVAALP